MATVLMVESWLHSTGLRLPPLLADLGHDYVLMTRDPSLYRGHPVLEAADEVVVVDTNDTSATLHVAAEVGDRRQIGGVLTTCDYYLETAAHVAAVLALPGPDPEAMHEATRKHLVRWALRAAGIPDARFRATGCWSEVTKAASHLGYPLIAKPVDANSGTSVHRVTDEVELREAYDAIVAPTRNTRGQSLERQVLLEEELVGPEVSVETVTRDGDTTVVAITAKSVLSAADGVRSGFVEAAHLIPAPLDATTRNAVETLVRRAIAAVGIRHGVAHVEIRLTSAGPRLVELNPRQCGGYIFDLVRHVTGVDPLRLLVDLALGNELPDLRAEAASAAVAFVMAPTDGELTGIQGPTVTDPRVVNCDLPTPGPVRCPSDNNDRLGHVMAVSPDGGDALEVARSAVSSLALEIDHEWCQPLIPAP